MKTSFVWSVRRELWEHRSIWLTPLAVAGFVILAFAVAAGGHVEKSGSFAAMPPEQLRGIVLVPFSMAAAVILFTGFAVAAFYCLDALNAERRDRSILFWKSMPVSDATTVLSKAFIPLAVSPAIAYVVALATTLVLLVPASIFLKSIGMDVGPLVQQLPLPTMMVAMLYGVVAHALWYAPIYALLLVASVAARRPLPWVIVPVIVVQVLEKIAFGTGYSGAFVKYRLMGAMGEAFVPGALKGPITSLSQLDPVRFLSSPGLWLGLLFAAAFLYAAIHLRRSREPL